MRQDFPPASTGRAILIPLFPDWAAAILKAKRMRGPRAAAVLPAARRVCPAGTAAVYPFWRGRRIARRAAAYSESGL